MASPQEQEALEYLAEHQILELIDSLTSMLLYYRPAKPLEFLIEQLEQLKVAKTIKKNYPCLFDESNLDAVFGILDTTKKGHITLVQYTEALKTLGVKDFAKEPSGADDDKIRLAIFKAEAKAGLMKMYSPYKPG
ncbi:LOW QUALITY PROTEIN: EF-hand calcium-binding domain-containing protein 10 [Leucoraja erinacea]|uniref:LOW QUALITY PROTEIN: EF-hand calcium-binding domain-containing protein 10 n=1 Tax=Leucoraja erinaceus TaxID=7782 RepID=UPI0024543C3C|nr:LOW QUALITY PROTEIN: EF-hand calcium-binding domain-containing protein 10 [Leucoraja erinacea]